MKAKVRDKIGAMREIELSAEALIDHLLRLSQSEIVCILDSCGVGHLGSHLLIAGVEPVEVIELSGADPTDALAVLDTNLNGGRAGVFTLSYEFGKKIAGTGAQPEEDKGILEPDVFLALFDTLIVHDYDTGRTRMHGRPDRTLTREQRREFERWTRAPRASVTSNFTRAEYLFAVEQIKERIRAGDTYQTNLTQQLTVELPTSSTPAAIFQSLRREHPAPFASYIRRGNSTVVSASPERFLRIDQGRISTSPIKGTRPRGAASAEDDALRDELLNSQKDRAENTMIVDLLRNDLGRVCEFGSVRVEKLCDIEEHPTLFHLVSTVSGDLRKDVRFSDVLRAAFPCGSVTGAPKISTMQIIDEIETAPRGLSMGAIGYSVPPGFDGLAPVIDLGVAIRTMVIAEQTARFNVGGGIVIDSDPKKEYEESLLKARALLRALGSEPFAVGGV